jgi:hypothetical protein
MIIRTLWIASFATLVLGCSSGGDDGDSTPTGANGSGQQGTPAASQSAPDAGPVYSFSCDGTVRTTNLDLDLALTPRCIGGPPGTRCGSPDECAAQDVKFHYEPPANKCIATDVFAWDGADCVAHSTHGEGGMLKCVGADCASLFNTKDACLAKYTRCLAK